MKSIFKSLGCNLLAYIALMCLGVTLGHRNLSIYMTFVKQVTPVRFYSDDNFPEHVKVNLPALSPTMELGTIVR